jgi:hypothetical protein
MQEIEIVRFEEYVRHISSYNDALYKHSLIINGLDLDKGRSSVLNQITNLLKLNENIPRGLLGTLFLKNKFRNADHLSVVMIFRNGDDLDYSLAHHSQQDSIIKIHDNDTSIEVMKLKHSNLKLKFKNTTETGSIFKTVSFKNDLNLDLDETISVLSSILEEKTNAINSIIVTKSKIFIGVHGNCIEDLMRILLIAYRTDFGLIECETHLVLVEVRASRRVFWSGGNIQIQASS